MVQIIKNFIPDFYKKISKKRYNKKSFLSLVGGYIVIEFFLFMISVSENLKHTLDHTSLFIKNVAMIIVGITILVDILGMILFENAKRKKVAVTIAYISGVIFLYFILITLGLLSEYPTKRIIEGIFLFNFLWLLGITLNSCMVYLSLSKGTMIYRDKYANYYINFLSFIAIMLAVISSFTEMFIYLYISCILILSVLKIIAVYHIPRVLQYWKKEPERSKNTRIYGKSIELMKSNKHKR